MPTRISKKAITISTPPGVLSFRQPRYYDYSKRSVMRSRAAAQRRRRKLAEKGMWVVGKFAIAGGVVHLLAVRLEPGWWIDQSQQLLTSNIERFARWRTRQAAHQWLSRHRWPGCHLVNLEQLTSEFRRAGTAALTD